MIAVDTNILIEIANEDAPHHDSSRRWLDETCGSGERWGTTWPVVYEFIRVTTHRNVMRTPWSLLQAWAFLDVLLAAPGAEMILATPRHAEIAINVFGEVPFAAGNIIHDLHTVVLMREHGIRQICTRDSDFRRFPGIEVVDPVRA